MEALQNLFKILRGLKRKKTPAYIACPKCGSRQIHRLRLGWPGITPLMYSCDECGYNGPLVLELEKER